MDFQRKETDYRAFSKRLDKRAFRSPDEDAAETITYNRIKFAEGPDTEAVKTILTDLYTASQSEVEDDLKDARAEIKSKIEAVNQGPVDVLISVQATADGRLGETTFDFTTNQLRINIDPVETNKHVSIGDELTHALRFINEQQGYIIIPGETIVRSLGYDMQDEVASKYGSLNAADVYDKEKGSTTTLTNTLQEFRKAATDPIPEGKTRDQMIEEYFQNNPSAQQYLTVFAPAGKDMASELPGTGDLLANMLKSGDAQEGYYNTNAELYLTLIDKFKWFDAAAFVENGTLFAHKRAD